MPPVLLLDTYSLFFRSFHALPMMNTQAGRPTNALFGFSSLLIKLWREEKPVGTTFALDAPARTFRHELYPEYKAERARAPEPLVVQLRVLDELIEKSELPAFRVPGFEADDVLATLARELESSGSEVLVVSGDRDLLQLATSSTKVLFTGRRGKDSVLYDPSTVQERFGIPPRKLPAYIALVGDTSDNIRGVAGIGPGTAEKLLAKYEGIDDLLVHVSEQPAAIRAKLEPEADRIRRNEELATLRRDVPLPEGARSGRLGARGREALRALFTELEFKSLIARFDATTASLEA
jgi:DNA polymerase-1